jgi:hypothetical protein
MARATKLTFSIHSTKLVFSLRRFRTQKANRSKRLRQLVFPVYGLPIREVAITRYRIGRRKPRPVLRLRPSLLLAVIGLLGTAYFSMHLRTAPDLKLVSAKPVKSTVAPQPKPAQHLSPAIPTRIRIASVDINTALQPVGLSNDGSLQVPSDPYMAGWYQNSPTPGEIGPTVIDGHVDQVGGIAIFWRLRYLQPGATIEIDRADGSTAHFLVDSLRQFPQNAFPTQQVYGDIDYAGLRLITCGGSFDTITQHYSDNTVVFGRLAN